VDTMLRADARANRDRLLAAAHEMLRERGVEAEIKEIAERAGVGVGTFYRNFPTKDDLIIAIAQEMFDAIAAVTEDAMAEADPIAALRSLIAGGLVVVQQYGDLMEMLHGIMPPGCKEQIIANVDPLARVGAVIQKGVDAGIYRPEIDIELVATSMIGIFHPGILAKLLETRTLDEIVASRLDLALGGLRR
jgi:AcrR family transcriptional regulator